MLCNACAAPIAKLDQGIGVGDKCGRFVSAIRPLTASDLETLAAREDIDAGVMGWVRTLSPADRATHLGKLHEFRTGDPMVCPVCSGCFVQVLSIEKDAVLDKSYVVELVTLAPDGQRTVAVRGKTLGATRDWIHEQARVVG